MPVDGKRGYPYRRTSDGSNNFLDVDKNPLIRTFEVESGSDTELIAGEVQNPLETRRQTAIRHLTHAAVEARYSKAFYHLIELERLRVLAGGGDPTTFDPASYLSIQLPPAEIQLWESGTRPFEIPKTFTFSASSIAQAMAWLVSGAQMGPSVLAQVSAAS